MKWLKRYAPLEVAALIGAIAGALIIREVTHNDAAAALGGAIGESLAFYGVAFVRGLKKHSAHATVRRSALSVRDLSLEFGVAELVDTFLIRSPLMYLLPKVTGNFAAGIIAAKVIADAVFYSFAAISYTLSRRIIDGNAVATAPVLKINLRRVGENYDAMVDALGDTRIHYAMKCNPHPTLLRYLHKRGSSFEVASLEELKILKKIGVKPADVLFSNPVKMTDHISAAHALGLDCFSFDSVDELHKISKHARGSRVYVRLHTVPAGSTVPSEGKFGVEAEFALSLLRQAKTLGLIPCGIGFHVGSQMQDVRAWEPCIEESAWIMTELANDGIKLQMLNIGGGFPAFYGESVPSIFEFGEAINKALEANLPYEVQLIAEPGRGLVADAGVVDARVIGIGERFGRRWAHLDIGAFNGMMESLETGNQLRFPMSDSRASDQTALFHVTGPSCDSQDTICFDVELSADLKTGDTVSIASTGAYTTSYASTFNGFSIPDVVFE